MAATFNMPVTPVEVGIFFLRQYYRMLQNNPDMVDHFYGDSSIMLRIDGNKRETASATSKLQIRQLVMTLNYTGIEIKTRHCLESWNDGLLLMACGSVRVKDFSGRRMFVETFFLAPEELGYFILNDIFHYVDEGQILQHAIAYLPQTNLEAKSNTSDIVEQVNNHMLVGDIQSLKHIASGKVEENDVQSNNPCQGTRTSTPDRLSSPIEEPVTKTQKHTYACKLAKGQSAAMVSSECSCSQRDSFEWQHLPKSSSQALVSSPHAVERYKVKEASVLEDEAEVKQVYVRDIPLTMSASKIAKAFEEFGKLKPDGVVIKIRKDLIGCYAFVEFEDISGAQNAIKECLVQVGEDILYVEALKPKRKVHIRGGRARGSRGRFSYTMTGRGRGRSSNHGSGRGEISIERDYHRT